MGHAIYRHDVAAWVATDALMAHLNGAEPPAGMRGWIVLDEGEGQEVRFVREDGGTLKAAFDVPVREGRAGAVRSVDEVLSASEAARFTARQTAIANVGRLRCSAQFNTVVLDDPESDGWLVWLLTATAEADVVPMGGHYRFRISPDGTQVLRRDMLSNSCLNMSRGEGAAGLMVTQIVSKGPIETHVFLSLQTGLLIGVVADDKIYLIEGGEISEREL